MSTKRASSGAGRYSGMCALTEPARTPAGTTARPRRGFTLIELLVVVAIIALLASILVPSLQKARRMAKLLVCETNIKNFSMGLTMYASMDSQGMFPPRSRRIY